jgi:hypothetical protein
VSDEEYYELTTPQAINKNKGRMQECLLGILPVKSDMATYGASILPRKSNVSGFINTDRHAVEYIDNGGGSVSHTIVKKPRKY